MSDGLLDIRAEQAKPPKTEPPKNPPPPASPRTPPPPGGPRRTEAMEQSRRRTATAEEVSEYLGVPVDTLYAWRYRSKGPKASKVGRYLRYRWSDVERWFDEQAKDAT